MGTDNTLILRKNHIAITNNSASLLSKARDELVNLAGDYLRKKDIVAFLECTEQAGRISAGLARRQKALRGY